VLHWQLSNPAAAAAAAAAAALQDLAKAKLWQKQQARSRQQDFAAPPIQLARSLSDPHSCTLQQWAPPGGPVRPLLQVCYMTCYMLQSGVFCLLSAFFYVTEVLSRKDALASALSIKT
jgi:hypothetical protein